MNRQRDTEIETRFEMILRDLESAEGPEGMDALPERLDEMREDD